MINYRPLVEFFVASRFRILTCESHEMKCLGLTVIRISTFSFCLSVFLDTYYKKYFFNAMAFLRAKLTGHGHPSKEFCNRWRGLSAAIATPPLQTSLHPSP